MITDAELAAIRERLEAATPGEWTIAGRPPCVLAIDKHQRLAVFVGRDGNTSVLNDNWNDLTFIAHAPADIATLLAALEASQAEVERLLAALEASQAECKRLKARDTFLDKARDAKFIKQRNQARRWAAAWKEAAKKLWLEDRFWDKHSLVEIANERDGLRAEVKRLRGALETAYKVPDTRTIKEDWQPKPPNVQCPVCERYLTTKIAHHDGDGWGLFWDCPKQCDENIDYEIEWPFEQNTANAEHFRAASFIVVY